MNLALGAVILLSEGYNSINLYMERALDIRSFYGTPFPDGR